MTNENDTGAGAESMTTHYGPGAGPDEVSETILGNQEASDCLIPVRCASSYYSKYNAELK